MGSKIVLYGHYHTLLCERFYDTIRNRRNLHDNKMLKQYLSKLLRNIVFKSNQYIPNHWCSNFLWAYQQVNLLHLLLSNCLLDQGLILLYLSSKRKETNYYWKFFIRNKNESNVNLLCHWMYFAEYKSESNVDIPVIGCISWIQKW